MGVLFAKYAIATRAPVEPNHPLVTLRNRQRDLLKRLGLDPEPDQRGAELLALDAPGHGESVIRAAASPEVGLTAKGARVALYLPSPDMRPSGRTHAPALELAPPQPEFADAIDELTEVLLGRIESDTDTVRALTREIKEAPQAEPRVINWSQGTTVIGAGSLLAGRMLTAPKGSPLHQEAVRVLGRDIDYPENATDADVFPNLPEATRRNIQSRAIALKVSCMNSRFLIHALYERTHGHCPPLPSHRRSPAPQESAS